MPGRRPEFPAVPLPPIRGRIADQRHWSHGLEYGTFGSGAIRLEDDTMGIWAWVALLVGAAAFATIGQYLVSLRDRESSADHWVYMAVGALVGGFTGHAWYPGTGPVFDGLNVLPAVAGGLIGAVALELVYRFVLRPRQPNA